MSVNWDKIKAEVNANPQHVQQLVDILSMLTLIPH